MEEKVFKKQFYSILLIFKNVIVREGLILLGTIVLAFFIGVFFLPNVDKLILGGQKFPNDPTANILAETSRWEIIRMTEFFLVLILYPFSLLVRIIIWAIRCCTHNNSNIKGQFTNEKVKSK